MKLRQTFLKAAALCCIALALPSWRVAAQDADADRGAAVKAPPVKLRDGDRLQLTMQLQAALRAAEAELAQLDDAERARRIRTIAQSVQDPTGEMAAALRPTRAAPLAPAAPRAPATQAPASDSPEARATARAQAQYLAEVARLRQTWPANPSAEDYARLESLKDESVPEE